MEINNEEVLILRGHEVSSVLNGQEQNLIEIVQRAYGAHAKGASSLPHSTFLRFPNDESNRIIALPAYLGQEFGVAGIKWVSSFPGNLTQGIDRASAVVILNSPHTGRPQAILEGSIISAKRTAASAALAAKVFHNGRQNTNLGIIGTGLINFEILKSILASSRKPQTIIAFDIDTARTEQFKQKCLETLDGLEVRIENDINNVLKQCSLISFATTASRPYVTDLSACPENTTILHVSLRDLAPEVILASDNVADDIDHVCRANTSLHLAEQIAGHRDFIRCNLADVLAGMAPVRPNGKPIVFSPFGLGVLDLAVGKHAYDFALERGLGTSIGQFLPVSWTEQN
jgi:N-[(2S)-2-amino-2-carboxyethyl]-L-glutamate dehydrogenase